MEDEVSTGNAVTGSVLKIKAEDFAYKVCLVNKVVTWERLRLAN